MATAEKPKGARRTPAPVENGVKFGNQHGQVVRSVSLLRGEMMIRLSRGHGANREEKKVFLLEFVAAFAIFSIVAVVLYMVFSYKPV